jgi:cytochrome d ubiquinol oxidase subunit II
MTAANGILAVIAAGAVAYTVLGGADFGGGIWDMLAVGPRRDPQRRLIAAVMGPVWEANHVWLVFVLIGGFSGFPVAFGQLSRMLAVPLAVALLGIVLRGAAFVFRQYGSTGQHGSDGPGRPVPGTATWGRVFAIASTIAPASLGLCAGAVAVGRIGGWFPPVAAALTLVFCAYLAAVFLCREAIAHNEIRLAEDFRRRAIAAGVAAGAIALAALPILASEAGPVAGHLVTRAAVLVATSAAAGVGSIAALYRRWYRFARVLAAIAVGAVLAGWAVAQYPYLVLGLTVSAAAAPPSTLPVTLAVLVAGFAVTLPALALLMHTFTRAETGLR